MILMAQIHPEIILAIKRSLDEDIGSGDVTSNSIFPPEAKMAGQIVAKQDGIIAGLDVAQTVYATYDSSIEFEAETDDGAMVKTGQVVAVVSGSALSLLTAERTALNFLGRISGIATLTRQFVNAVAGTQAVILDTRKTAPGLRRVDKMAVVRGGGKNHRIGLFDMILIKDNHIDFAGSISAAVQNAKNSGTQVDIEVEARTLEHVKEALTLGVERILLDNMSLDMMREAVQITNGRAKLEASGNVTLETVRAIAETGVDYISIGALTHSVKVFDVSFQYIN